MSTILNGEKMVLTHTKTNYELPPVGVKDFEPNHSWLEQKQIQSALDHRKTLLETERVEKESNLMMADWMPEKHKAAVTRKGKHWETFGHHSDNTDWLFPEEVLFLMEMNCLQCFHGEVPLSIQKGYSILLEPQNGCSFEEYRVFAHLCRAGYRVLRHLPNLTVTGYERTIRLDQHLKERKTYGDVVNTEEGMSVGAVSAKTEKIVDKPQKLSEPQELVTERSLKKPEETILNKTQVLDVPEEIVGEKTQETQVSKTSLGELTRRKLRKLRRKNKGVREKFLSLRNKCNIKNSQALRVLQRRKLSSILGKYKKSQEKFEASEDKSHSKEQSTTDELNKMSFTPYAEEVTPEIPSERWQPPVVIGELPEDMEIRIVCTPSQAETGEKDKALIEVIDIADTSSEEEEEEEEEEDVEEVDSDSDIEIIKEIKAPTVTNNSDEEEDGDEDEDDLEIIEVPVPKKMIPLEILSSDEEEGEDEDNCGSSDSEESYDGNWKRRLMKTRFVRPPTMSRFTFASVDEFCSEKKLPRENVNGENILNGEANDRDRIRFETSISIGKQPVFRVEKTRNEILDSMPTMAGQNRKLMTLDSPDLRLIPDHVIPKQRSYTYSTNALRARVFRQGFRGRRNFHGPRYTSFNPYYNNTNGNFYPNQLNVGGLQGLFQAPQLAGMLGGGDINSVARGVMQIASALLMNMPQNNMRNALFPYNPSRPHFPLMNQSFAQQESPRPRHRFPMVNYSCNEPLNMNHHGFNTPQRNNSDLQHLFDMPQQRNFGTTNHIRFPDSSNSPVVENHQNGQNFSMDLSQSPESDFTSRDHNFTPPIRISHGAGRSFRDNRASNFIRKRGGRYKGRNQNHRGGFSQRNSRGGKPIHARSIDPAYIKPDVPIPGEQNSVSLGGSGFIPLSSSTSNQKPLEIINIDDNDEFVPKGGISYRFTKKKRRKRKMMRSKKTVKKKRLNQQRGVGAAEIVFLDSPVVSSQYSDGSTTDSVKQEQLDRVKIEKDENIRNIKLEEVDTPEGSNIKQEPAETSSVKAENETETRVKTEEASGESSFRVKVEDGHSGQNVRVEIKIESSSDTSSVVSLPLTNLVKEESSQVKLESAEGSEVKTEAIDVIESVKTEVVDERETKEGILEATDRNNDVRSIGGETSERPPVEPMDTSASIPDVRTDSGSSAVEVDSEVSCSRTSEEIINKKFSSWAEVKRNNVPLSTSNDTESQDETEDEIEGDEVRPILRPKHCKTIGTVLSALQIFAPFTTSPPEDIIRLRISFDLYLPTDFRKSHRGLPQYRIVVFSGTEPLPSPAQLREVNSRFEDRVPVLTAVVTPGSVVFYTFTDIDLPQDTNSYSK